jgi:hypothetical protein
MSASRHFKVLSVRLPEPEIIRFKNMAASRGVTVQEAVHLARETWASGVSQTRESFNALQGSLAEVDVEDLMRRELQAELAGDQRSM